jgi:hypothetical protein
MNKLEQFIVKITERTKNGSIKWQAISPSRRERLVWNSSYCTRLFECDLDEQRGLIAAEKKVPSLDPDMEEYFDRAEFEVLLVHEAMIDKTITSYDVSKDLLIELIETISAIVFDSDHFIDDFLGK